MPTSVTQRTLVQRINRKLAHQDKRLCKSRSFGDFSNLGSWYVLDTARNAVVDHHVTPESLGRELGVLLHGAEVMDDKAA